MRDTEKALCCLKFIFLLLLFLGAVAVSIWALSIGNLLAAGLGGVASLVLGIWASEAFQELVRTSSNIIKIELFFDEEVIADIEKIRKYYEFKTIEQTVCDSLDLSIMALKEQTEHDRILCLYDKQSKEIIAIDSMTSDGEIWEEVDGKNERDMEDIDDDDEGNE